MSEGFRIPIDPLIWEPDNPLATEHGVIADLIEQILRTGWMFYPDPELNSTNAGKRMLESDPEAASRFVLALVEQTTHYENLARRVRALAKN